MLSRVLANELIAAIGCLRNISETPGTGVSSVFSTINGMIPALNRDKSLSEVSDGLALELRFGLLHDL
jgi:hypothetical protein